MRTVRRLYLYAVSAISLEVLLWGMIGLARSLVCNSRSLGLLCSSSFPLALGLAAVIAGIPFFVIHWGLAQRSAARDEEERASGVRAVFLYGMLLGTLIPIVQSVLSMLDRLALQAAGVSPTQAFLGPTQNWTDNLIAVVMNAVFFAYFLNVLRGDWKTIQRRQEFADVRRLYRHLWMAYTLVIVIAAVQQLLRYVLAISPGLAAYTFRATGAHGIVLALVGTPLWYFAWKDIRKSLADPAERNSTLRLANLYLLALAGVVIVLISAGVVLNVILRALLGEPMSAGGFLGKISRSLSIGVPLAGVWAYFGGWLEDAIAGTPDAIERAGRRRLYISILSAIGLGATFTGLSMLLSFVVDASFGNIIWAEVLRPRLAVALATLLVSLPLWGLRWRRLQAEALETGSTGDHARRSLIRRVYLYLALFAGVVGGMVLSVQLLNLLLRAALGSGAPNLLQQSLKYLEELFLFLGLGLYHGLALRRDGRLAAAALAEKHAAFPVWVFEQGEGGFSAAIVEALHKQAPNLPVTVQDPAGKYDTGKNPEAVILPLNLLAEPPFALQDWLKHYQGARMVVPLEEPDAGGKSQLLTPGGSKPVTAAAAQAATTLRRLAEGQEVKEEARASGWMIVVYIAAALFGLEALLGLASAVVSLFGG